MLKYFGLNSLFEGIDLAREGNNVIDVVTKALVHGFNDSVFTLPDSKKGKGLSKIGNVLVSSGTFWSS